MCRLKRNIKILLNRNRKIPYVQVKQKNAKSSKFISKHSLEIISYTPTQRRIKKPVKHLR